MEQYLLKDVIAFLEVNPDREFDFGRSLAAREGKMPVCLMAAFFVSKGIDFVNVSYNGWNAMKNGAVVAAIMDRPKSPAFTQVRDVHGLVELKDADANGSYTRNPFGSEILDRIKKLM